MTHNSGECHGDLFALSTRVAFKILALVASDSLKALIKIAYREWNIMEKTLEVTVCSVNTGKVINTRREVLEGLYIITLPWHAATRLVFDFFVSFKRFILLYTKKPLCQKKNGLISYWQFSPGKLGNFVLCSY